MAVIEAKVAIPEDAQACLVWRFVENTFLQKSNSQIQFWIGRVTMERWKLSLNFWKKMFLQFCLDVLLTR